MQLPAQIANFLTLPPPDERELAEIAADYDRASRAMRNQYWQSRCERYGRIDMRLLPCLSATARVLNWWPRRGEKNGLILVGPSGTGKTYTAWLILSAWLYITGQSLVALDGVAFSNAVSLAASDPECAEDWLGIVSSAQVLFLDDLFKGNMTDAQGRFLFAIVERRMRNGLPIVVTSNATGKDIAARMSEPAQRERCDAIFRRLRECCVAVTFRREKQEEK